MSIEANFIGKLLFSRLTFTPYLQALLNSFLCMALCSSIAVEKIRMSSATILMPGLS